MTVFLLGFILYNNTLVNLSLQIEYELNGNNVPSEKLIQLVTDEVLTLIILLEAYNQQLTYRSDMNQIQIANSLSFDKSTANQIQMDTKHRLLPRKNGFWEGNEVEFGRLSRKSARIKRDDHQTFAAFHV